MMNLDTKDEEESGIQCREDTTDTFSMTQLGLAIVADDCTDFYLQKLNTQSSSKFYVVV